MQSVVSSFFSGLVHIFTVSPVHALSTLSTVFNFFSPPSVFVYPQASPYLTIVSFCSSAQLSQFSSLTLLSTRGLLSDIKSANESLRPLECDHLGQVIAITCFYIFVRVYSQWEEILLEVT